MAARARRNMPPVQPPNDFYDVDEPLRLVSRLIPFSASNQGMGTQLSTHPEMSEVLVNRRGDGIRTNTTDKPMALRIMSLVLDHMRGRRDNPAAHNGDTNRIGERASFNHVIRAENERLLNLANLAEEPITDRRANVYWRVFHGFNEDPDGGVNDELDDILDKYCKIRLGMAGFRNVDDEFQAACTAIQMYYLEHTRDNGVVDQGTWALILVHMLNAHMIHHGMTPISFSPVAAEDIVAEETQRRVNSRRIWAGQVPFKVESRANIITNDLMWFGQQRMNVAYDPVPNDDGPPEPGNDGGARNVRPRRSLR